MLYETAARTEEIHGCGRGPGLDRVVTCRSEGNQATLEDDGGRRPAGRRQAEPGDQPAIPVGQLDALEGWLAEVGDLADQVHIAAVEPPLAGVSSLSAICANSAAPAAQRADWAAVSRCPAASADCTTALRAPASSPATSAHAWPAVVAASRTRASAGFIPQSTSRV